MPKSPQIALTIIYTIIFRRFPRFETDKSQIPVFRHFQFYFRETRNCTKFNDNSPPRIFKSCPKNRFLLLTEGNAHAYFWLPDMFPVAYIRLPTNPILPPDPHCAPENRAATEYMRDPTYQATKNMRPRFCKIGHAGARQKGHRL